MKDTCIVEWKCTLTRNDCKLPRWSPCEDGEKELVSVVDLEKSLIFCQSLLNTSKFWRRSLVMDVPLFHHSIRCHYACRSPPSNSRVRWGKCFKMGKKVEMELSSTSTQLLPYIYMNFRFYRESSVPLFWQFVDYKLTGFRSQLLWITMYPWMRYI